MATRSDASTEATEGDQRLPQFVLSFDGDTVRVNDAVTETFGWTFAELTSIPYWELVHPADQDAAVVGIDALLCRRVATYEESVSVLRRDGVYRRGRWIAWVGDDGSSLQIVEVSGENDKSSARRTVGTWSWDGARHELECSEEVRWLFGWQAGQHPAYEELLDAIDAKGRALLDSAVRGSPSDDPVAVTVEVRSAMPARWVRVAARSRRDQHSRLHVKGIAFDATGLPELLPATRADRRLG